MNKKRYLILVAIIIFIFLSLFTFANPFEKEEINDSRVLDEIEEDELVEEKLDNTIITNPVPNIIDIEDNSYDLALNAVVRAEVSLEKEKYNIALSLTNNVKDEVKKVELEERLEKVLDTIDLINLVKELIEKTNTSKNKIELDGARDYEKTNEMFIKFNYVLCIIMHTK